MVIHNLPEHPQIPLGPLQEERQGRPRVFALRAFQQTFLNLALGQSPSRGEPGTERFVPRGRRDGLYAAPNQVDDPELLEVLDLKNAGAPDGLGLRAYALEMFRPAAPAGPDPYLS